MKVVIAANTKVEGEGLDPMKCLGHSPYNPEIAEDLIRLNQYKRKKSSTLSQKEDIHS